MAIKRGLASGRGLSALLGDIQNQQSSPSDDARVAQFSLSSLKRGQYQPRRDIQDETLNELAASITEHGVMQPIVVRALAKPDGAVTHEIIAGERRWRAAKIAGLKTVPAIERELSDEVAIALALIENIQREDLSAIEQARALERFVTEFGMSHEEVAKTVGKARATVSNLLRLLSLNDQVQLLLERGELDMGHARALLSAPHDQQLMLAKKVIAGKLTVRQTEALVSEFLHPAAAKPAREDTHTLKLSEFLSENFGAKVEIKSNKSGAGKLTINYHDAHELDGILHQMGINLNSIKD